MKQLQFNKLLNTTTNRLVAICVVVYFLFSGPQGEMLIDKLALQPYSNPGFQYWQLLSYLFLHGGLAHLMFNMIALWSFGNALEAVWGGKRFLLFFVLCGLGAGVVQLLYGEWQFNNLYQELLHAGIAQSEIMRVLELGSYPKAWLADLSQEQVVAFYQSYAIPAVGASGSIYGVLVAFALLFPNNKLVFIFLPYPIAAKHFVPILLVIDLLSGVTGFALFGLNIAHFAHLGGALTGFILMLYWRRTLGAK